jgi:hypothetical protein
MTPPMASSSSASSMGIMKRAQVSPAPRLRRPHRLSSGRGAGPGNTHASHGALAVLKRLIKKLKRAYPGALILFRADAGFAVPALYRYLERQEIRYVIGFITNNRVVKKAAPLLKKAQAAYQATGEKQRLFTSFS